MQDARIRAALIALCLACLLGSGYVLLKGRSPAPPPIVFSSPSAATSLPPAGNLPAAVKRPARVYVDVAGAVRRPALYLLPPNSRVMQAVMAAGGPTGDADLGAVNLASPVTDGEKVYVPTQSAAPVSPSAASNPSTRSAAPVIMQSAPKAGRESRTKSSSKGGAKAAAPGKIDVDSGEQIGLNSATAEQLERLPTVGPSMAARILAYRQQAGSFSKVEDLMLVTGIGPKKFAKIAPFVSLD